MTINDKLLDHLPTINAMRHRYAESLPVRVLFVCLGNICRSPAAQGILQACINKHGDTDAWIIDSAGTGGWHVGDLPDNRMRIHARRRGYELTHRSRRVTGDDFVNFDLIVGMDSGNVYSLREMAASPEEARKIVPMGQFIRQFPHYDHVPDPYYEGSEGFELVLDLLEDACEALLDYILKNDFFTK